MTTTNNKTFVLSSQKLQFCKVPHLIVTHENLSIYSKAVYLALSMHYPNISPSISRIASLLNITKPTVIKSIKELEREKLIEVLRVTTTRNKYRISSSQSELST